jgi:hypothetical protein
MSWPRPSPPLAAEAGHPVVRTAASHAVLARPAAAAPPPLYATHEDHGHAARVREHQLSHRTLDPRLPKRAGVREPPSRLPGRHRLSANEHAQSGPPGRRHSRPDAGSTSARSRAGLTPPRASDALQDGRRMELRQPGRSRLYGSPHHPQEQGIQRNPGARVWAHGRGGTRAERRFTCVDAYARAGGLTSAPGCSKLARACGEAGRRKTAGLAEDTPTKSRDGSHLSRTNWMCRPDRVVDHRQVEATVGNHPATAIGSLRLPV